jgi:2-methylisocitrate lyase-like PEP mutase family enzyme
METLPTRIIGIYSPLQAKLLKHLGGTTAWISGYGISADQFGFPDLNVMSYTEKLDRQLRITNAADLDYIVDLDNGIANPYAFEQYLDRIGGEKSLGVCIEDERHPKVSALYKSSQPLMSHSEFSTTLNSAAKHKNLRVYARTNALVRGYSLTDVEQRVARILGDTMVRDVVLHGNRLDDVKSLLERFKERARFFLITSLAPTSSFDVYHRMGLTGLILGHNLIFDTIHFQETCLIRLLQMDPVAAPHEKGRSLVETLIPTDLIS